jgi:hypothetical protein
MSTIYSLRTDFPMVQPSDDKCRISASNNQMSTHFLVNNFYQFVSILIQTVTVTSNGLLKANENRIIHGLISLKNYRTVIDERIFRRS